MSGVTRKGPDRPAKEEVAGSAEAAPLYTSSGMNMEGKWPVRDCTVLLYGLVYIMCFHS